MDFYDSIKNFLYSNFDSTYDFVYRDKELCDNCSKLHHFCHSNFSIYKDGYCFFDNDPCLETVFSMIENFSAFDSSLNFPIISNKYFCKQCYSSLLLEFENNHFSEDDPPNLFYISFDQNLKFEKYIIAYSLLETFSVAHQSLSKGKKIYVYSLLDLDVFKRKNLIDNFSFYKNSVSLDDIDSLDSFEHFSLCRFGIRDYDITFCFENKNILNGYIPTLKNFIHKEDITSIEYFNFKENSWSSNHKDTVADNVEFSFFDKSNLFIKKDDSECLNKYILELVDSKNKSKED